MSILEHCTGPGLLNLTSRELGTLGEDIASSYLETHGWKIHTRNFRTRYGEIDIVANDGDTLVFVEVKTRRTRTYGPGIHAITGNKIMHAKRAIGAYLMDHSPPHRDVRIDAIDIFLRPGENPYIEHYRSIET